MSTLTVNRLAAPVTAAALAASTVVAPIVMPALVPDLPSISVSAADIDLMADSVFNPDVPLLNWADLGFAPLTPIPQLLLQGLISPALLIPTFSVLAPFLSALPALPLAGLIAGPDHILTELANSIPALDGIAEGYNDIAQSVAGFLGDIPLVGQPITTAFQMLPLLSQWMMASVVNPLPLLFDTSPFWQSIGGLFGGDDVVGSAAAGGLFDFDLSGLLGGLDLGSLFDFDLSGLFDGLVSGVGDLLGGFDLDLSGLLGGFDLPFDLDFGDITSALFAPIGVVGLPLMLAPLMAGMLPLMLGSWAGSTFF